MFSLSRGLRITNSTTPFTIHTLVTSRASGSPVTATWSRALTAWFSPTEPLVLLSTSPTSTTVSAPLSRLQEDTPSRRSPSTVLVLVLVVPVASSNSLRTMSNVVTGAYVTNPTVVSHESEGSKMLDKWKQAPPQAHLTHKFACQSTKSHDH